MPCDDLKGWEGSVGRQAQSGGIRVHKGLIHFMAQQELTQHCTAIIHQFKKAKERKKKGEMTGKNGKTGFFSTVANSL